MRNFKTFCYYCGRETRQSTVYGAKPIDWCSYCLKGDGFYRRKGEPKKQNDK